MFCLVSYKVIHRFLAYRISFIGYLFIKWVKRKRNYHSKKRIFPGNQYTKNVKTFSRDRTEENSASENNENQSPSIKKLKIPPSLAAADLSDDHFILINFSILQELIKTINGSCVECSSKEISVKNIVDKKKG